MSWMLPLGQVFGIRLRAHFSWLFIFLLVAWSLATGYLPVAYPTLTAQERWTVGIIGSALLFVCVLLHELSHSLVALYRGHRVHAITLFFLGGVSEIEEESHSAGEEFWISVVGPATSFLLAALIFVADWALVPDGSRVAALTGYLILVNVMLGGFNLIPAYPLDGGRVLKAMVWRATGSRAKAVNLAAIFGSALGFGIIGIGVMLAITANLISGLWLVFIGWFLQSSSAETRRSEAAQAGLQGKLVRDAMQEQFIKVPPNISVQELVDRYITQEFQRAYVVTLGDGFQGLVTLGGVKDIPPGERPNRYVTDVMARAPSVVTISPEAPLEQALRQLAANDLNQLVVVKDNQAVGLINRGDVLRVLEISQEFRD